MKTEISYEEAFRQLEKLAAELEDGNIPLDKLQDKLGKANELLSICENKLRNIQNGLANELK